MSLAVGQPKVASRADARHHRDYGTLLNRSVAVLLIVGTLGPLGFLIYGSFLSGFPGQAGTHLTTASAKAVYTTGKYLTAIRWSIVLAVPTATLATALAAIFAWLFFRTNLIGRRFWAAALNGAFALPAVFASLAWIALLAPGAGLLNVLAHKLWGGGLYDIKTAVGITAVMVTVFVPFAYQLVSGAFATADFTDEEAARVHGASLLYVAFRVTMPQLRSSLVVAWVIIFAISSQTFSVVLLLGQQSRITTVALDMYQALGAGAIPIATASMLGTLLIWPGLLAFIGLLRYGRNSVARVATVQKVGQWSLGKLAVPAVVFVGGYCLVAIVLPLAALVFGSFEKFQTAHLTAKVFTLNNYSSAFHDQTVLTALANTIILGVAAATLGTMCAFLMSYSQLQDEQKVLSRTAHVLTAVSLSVPRLAFSLGALWCISETPGLKQSYGALWIIVGTIVIANIGIGMRTISAEMERMPRSWRDATMLSGGNHLSCMFRIVAPNILPTLVAIWRTFFILAILEIDLVLFLYQPRSITLSVLTLFRVSEGVSNTAYPLVVLELLATAAVLLVSALATFLLTRRRRTPNQLARTGIAP